MSSGEKPFAHSGLHMSPSRATNLEISMTQRAPQDKTIGKAITDKAI